MTTAVTVVACGAGVEPVRLGEIPTEISIVGGDFQRLEPGETAPIDLAVRVADAEGLPVPGVAVEWIVEGGGSVQPINRTTDVGGKVIGRLTLNRTIGVRDVVARVASDTAVATLFTIFGGVDGRRPDQPDAEITIRMSGFNPTVVAIPVQGVVRWRWSGDSPHNIQFDNPDVPGATYRIEGVRDVVFVTAGSYLYRCNGHSNSGGFVTVNDYPEHPTHTGRVIAQ